MKIGIIGAGLSGLTCAWYLKKGGINDIVIYEASDRVGGKLKTDLINGYRLDRGFQVLLPAYPEAKKILDYNLLELQRFDKGSLIFKNDKKIPFYHPENGFMALLQTIFKGPGTFLDKLVLLKLKWTLSKLSLEQIFENKNSISSLQYLKQFGFSEKIIQDFWIPFYQGVFLENNLSTDSKMLQFTFKMFAESGAAVPKEGMEAIPKQLASFIGAEKIKLNAKVLRYDAKSITTVDGTEYFDKVVMAYNINPDVKYQTVSNKYFEAEKLPIFTKHVILNANKNQVVNNVVLISHVAKNYANNGKHLISVSANGTHLEQDEFMLNLKSIFGKQVNNWKLVNAYVIEKALPVVAFNKKVSPSLINDVFYCGDYLVQGSINGAMESGRITAEELLSCSKEN